MNMWEGMESERQREIRRDAEAAAAPAPMVSVAEVVRAHARAGGQFLVLVLLAVAGYLLWANVDDTESPWVTWGIIVGVGGFVLPVLTLIGLGEVVKEGGVSRAGLGVAWLGMAVALALFVTVPTVLIGSALTDPIPLDGDPVRIALSTLTPLMATLLMATIALQLWHLPLWLNASIAILAITATLATVLPLPYVAKGGAPGWVEGICVYGGLVMLPFVLIGLLLLPLHRVTSVSRYDILG